MKFKLEIDIPETEEGKKEIREALIQTENLIKRGLNKSRILIKDGRMTTQIGEWEITE